MILHKLLPFFVLTLNLLLLGSAVAAMTRSERNRSFAYLSLALAVWSLGVIGLRWSETASSALVWERFLHLGVVLIPVLFYQYVWVLLGESPRRPSVVAGYVVALAFVAVVATPHFMAGVRDTAWGFAPETGPLYGLFLVYFMTYMVLGLAVLARAHAGSKSTFRRNRLRLVLIGVVVSLLGGVVDFLRFTLGLEWLYPAGIPANTLFALALGVAIVRYRLMNVNVLAKRVLLYALTWAATAPALLFIVDALDHLAPPVATSPPVKVVALLTLLMLALPFMRQLERVLNRVMFHRERAIADALVALNRELSEILDVERLGATMTAALTTRVPVAHATLFVSSGDGDAVVARAASAADDCAPPPAHLSPAVALWVRTTRRTLVVDGIGCAAAADGPGASIIDDLERNGVALLVPIFADAELAAVLVIGEKLSGQVFDPAEIELLEVLAARAGTALKNARLYQALEAQMAELRATRDLYGQAREAARAKEHFLALLAHELRNPLAPILNAAQVLQSTAGGKEPRAARMIAMIRRQGHQLARLVDDLLDVSRIRLGKIRLNAEPLDLPALVAQCIETLRASGKAHGREIRSHTSGEELVVLGDSVRLEQVCWNLLDNALKYSPSHTPITVTVERDHDAAVLKVEDSGVGIQADMLPNIFDLFTQVDASLSKAQGGLGLGLALVRSLVEQHGGSVTAHSPGPGQGSTFVVRLPLTRDAADAGQARPPAPVSYRPRRVLLIEDAPDARESLRTLLEVLGHDVRCAADGASALEIAARWWPDLALVDIALPGMSGYEVAHRLRDMGEGHEAYLVAVTAYGEAEDRRRTLASGFDAHFVKPVSAEDVTRMIAARASVEMAKRRNVI